MTLDLHGQYWYKIETYPASLEIFVLKSKAMNFICLIYELNV